MLRITVNFCLFTFIILAQASFLNASIKKVDLPFEMKELLYLPEAEFVIEPNSLFEQLVSACEFSDRMHLLAPTSPAYQTVNAELGELADSEVDEAPPTPRFVRVDSELEPLAVVKETCPSEGTIAEVVEADFAIAEVAIADYQPLEPISTTLAPLVWIEGVKSVEISEIESKLSFENFKRIAIPMVFITEAVAELSEDEEMEVFCGEGPEAMDHAIEESPVSIELEDDGKDPYWQYYEDCDRWGVDFARLLLEGMKLEDAGASLTANVVSVSFEEKVKELGPASSGNWTVRLLGSLSPGSWLPSAIKMFEIRFKEVAEMIRFNEILQDAEFHLAEEEGIRPEMVNVKALSPITQLLVINHLNANSNFSGKLSAAKSLLDIETLSCDLYQLQSDISVSVQVIVSQALAVQQSQRIAYRNATADHIEQMAEILVWFAQAIRPAGGQVVNAPVASPAK